MKVSLDQVILENVVPPRMKNRYTLRVKDSKFSPNSKGDPMITLNCEIVNPLKIKAPDGKTYSLDSLRVPYYLTLAGKSLGTVLEAYQKLGFPPEEDTENPDLTKFDGLIFDAIIDSVEDNPQRIDPETGKFVPITDDEGKPLTGKWKIQAWASEILGVSSFTPGN